MRFLGVDFGWRSQPSGLAVLDAGSVRTGRAAEPDAVLEWIDRQCGDGPAMVAVDAPLVIPNPSGMRAADKLMHVHFGRFHAGCYPANLGLPFAGRVVAFSRALESRGFLHADRIEPGVAGRFQIEVYPHAAAVQLFGLDCILKYKKGPLAGRVIEMRRYRRLLRPLMGRGLPAVPSAPGTLVKDCEDRLDAALCAYVGWLWWTGGTERARAFGTAAEGYVVVPERIDGTAPARRT